MELSSCYPVLATADVAASARFWTEWFGFETTFAADWYVSLRRDGPVAVELALLAAEHPSIPAGFGHPARGVLINLEVRDVDAEYRRLVRDGGLRPVQDLRSEPFGQRHFILADPGGVLIDLITEIPPAPEYAAAFAAGAG